MDESHRSQIVQAVEQRMRSFEAAERALDAEQLVDHFVVGPDFYIYNDGQRLTYEIMATSIRSTFPTLRSIEGGFIDLHIMALAPDAALATARFQETVTDGSGSQTKQHGRGILVVAPCGRRVANRVRARRSLSERVPEIVPPNNAMEPAAPKDCA